MIQQLPILLHRALVNEVIVDPTNCCMVVEALRQGLAADYTLISLISRQKSKRLMETGTRDGWMVRYVDYLMKT